MTSFSATAVFAVLASNLFAGALCTTEALAQVSEVPAQEPSIAAPDVNAMVFAQPWETLQITPPPIINTIIVDGSLEDAWALWTDPERMPEFMGFDAEIEARPGGAYRVIFVEDAPTPLARGNDGRILAIEDHKMISFTWMTPMQMGALTGNSTVVTLYFTVLENGESVQIDLINTGYGLDDNWREAYAYNLRGWDRVLAHFEHAMEIGPIDWVERAKDLRRDGTLPMWREHKRKVLQGEDPYKR